MSPRAPGPVGRVLMTACFLSGAAALVYQVLWTRQIALVLGNTVAAISTVLATFMAGLGLGSAWASRSVDRKSQRGLARFYAGLECGIAAAALVLPFLPAVATPALRGGSRFLVSSLILLVPTTLMGATLPALVALTAPASAQLGRAAGILYAANTLGAVVGSLTTALVLLPGLGVRLSTFLAVALNVTAAGLVLAFGAGEASSVGEKAPRPRETSKKKPDAGRDGLAPGPVLVVIVLSGLGALADEVAWTRALILLLGPTAYAFAFILTAVIAGIALGSALAAPWADRLGRPARALGLVEWVAALSSLAVIRVIGRLPVPVGEMVRQYADRVDRLMALEFAGVVALLLVPCLCFGAAFPLAVRLLARATPEPGRVSGRVYAWNTAGAILGALLSGFVLLPRLGLEATLYAAADVHVLAGALAVAFSSAALTPRLLAGLAVVTALLVPRFGEAWDRELLSGGAYKYAAYAARGDVLETLRRGELVYYREGRAATVSVKRIGGTLALAIDGKVDATGGTGGADMLTQRLLAHVPLLLHPRPRRVCVIGLGSGVTAGSALAHDLESLDVVEVSAEVVEAAALFGPSNRQALRDPRIRVIVGDGRNHLLLASRDYDVIISEPSNPWMAGVSALFTRDFFGMARTRLRPGGLFCQWTHIYNMDARDLRTVVASFTDAFPASALFLVDEGDVLLIGAEGELPPLDAAALTRRMQEGPVREDLAGVAMTSPFAFAKLYALGRPALTRFVRDAVRHTDDRPVLEFRTPRFLHANTAQQNRDLIQAAAREDPLPEPYASLSSAASAAETASRARMLEQAESFEWAKETFREALGKDPRRPAALEGLVRCALRLGRSAEAEQEIKALVERAPVEGRIALGLLYHNLDRPAEALAQLEAAGHLDPRNLRALRLGAEIQGGAGNLDAMEQLARAALEVAPADAEAASLLALAHLRKGRVDEALTLAADVLRREPRSAQALEVAAIGRAQKGDRTGARQAFLALVAAEPDDASHWGNFAIFEMESGDLRSAARLFSRAVDVNPVSVPAWRGLREAARALGDGALLDRAEARLRRLGAT